MRGFIYIFIKGYNKSIEIFIASVIGILFYILLFDRISLKHIIRMKSKEIEKPCLFSFFDIRGYIVMSMMIATGITVRHYKIIPPDYLNTFYIGMGIPLIISSLKFFYVWHKDKHV
jgi:hypothetical protein